MHKFFICRKLRFYFESGASTNSAIEANYWFSAVCLLDQNVSKRILEGIGFCFPRFDSDCIVLLVRTICLYSMGCESRAHKWTIFRQIFVYSPKETSKSRIVHVFYFHTVIRELFKILL